jgi:hypothetical protein
MIAHNTGSFSPIPQVLCQLAHLCNNRQRARSQFELPDGHPVL